MKLKLKPLGRELFELSQLQTTLFTSSLVTTTIKNALSSPEIELKPTLSNLTWNLETPSNLAFKKSFTFALIYNNNFIDNHQYESLILNEELNNKLSFKNVFNYS